MYGNNIDDGEIQNTVTVGGGQIVEEPNAPKAKEDSVYKYVFKGWYNGFVETVRVVISSLPATYEIPQVTYPFELNDDGYYQNTNQKQKNTFEAEYKKDDFETRVVEGLSEEMYLEISKAYAKNYFVDYGLSIQKFYGEYNGAYVFSNRSTRTEPTSKIVIGSVEFPECPVIINVMVYKNGYVYTLREAYEIRNTINVEDLKPSNLLAAVLFLAIFCIYK